VKKQVRRLHKFDHVLELSHVVYFRNHFRHESAHFIEIFHIEQTVTGRMFKRKMKRKMKTPVELLFS
jgi:hypothetical protein